MNDILTEKINFKYFIKTLSKLMLGVALITFISCGSDDNNVEVDTPVVVEDPIDTENPIVVDSPAPYTYEDRTHTVDPEREDEGTGTDEDPWNPQQAMNLAEAGDICGWLPGIAVGPENPSKSRYEPAFRPNNSGTLENPIVHVAQTPATLTETGRTEIRSGATVQGDGRPAFGVLNRDYIHWIGFFSDEAASNNKGSNDSGPVTLWTTVGSSVRYCVIHGVETPIRDNHSGIRLENADQVFVSDNVISGFRRGGGSGVNQSGITTYSTTNTIFEHNEIYDVSHGIYHKGGTQYGNRIRFNYVHNVGDFMRMGGLFAGPSGELNYISQNIVTDYRHALEFTTSATNVGEPDGLRIAHNLFFRQTAGSSVNLWFIIDPNSEGAVPRNNRVFNNIFLDAEGGQLGARNDDPSWIDALAVFSNNIYFGHGSFFFNEDRGNSSPLGNISFETWQADPYFQDENSQVTDPKLIGSGVDDYGISSDSPCRNTGIDLMNLRGNGTDGAIHIGPFISDDNSEQFGVRR